MVPLKRQPHIHSELPASSSIRIIHHSNYGSLYLLQDHQGYVNSNSRIAESSNAQYAGEIPSMKLFESEKTLAFLDIGPLSLGHSVSFTTN